MEVIVFRYAHRFVRDARVSTHCCLVARALGAKKVILAGNTDSSFQTHIEEIVEKWGGSFSLEFTDHWKKTLKALKTQGYYVVHLTMYGLPLMKEIAKIRKKKKIVIIVGSERVPREVYELSDVNISVGNQPHSEIAALSIGLHELFQGKELSKTFKNAKLTVLPSARGKTTIKKQK